MNWSDAVAFIASPKSDIFIIPFVFRSIFAVLRSLWIISFEWQKYKPYKIWNMIHAISPSENVSPVI